MQIGDAEMSVERLGDILELAKIFTNAMPDPKPSKQKFTVKVEDDIEELDEYEEPGEDEHIPGQFDFDAAMANQKRCGAPRNNNGGNKCGGGGIKKNMCGGNTACQAQCGGQQQQQPQKCQSNHSKTFCYNSDVETSRNA